MVLGYCSAPFMSYNIESLVLHKGVIFFIIIVIAHFLIPDDLIVNKDDNIQKSEALKR